jgi:hypothetical protein
MAYNYGRLKKKTTEKLKHFGSPITSVDTNGKKHKGYCVADNTIQSNDPSGATRKDNSYLTDVYLETGSIVTFGNKKSTVITCQPVDPSGNLSVMWQIVLTG